MIRLDALLKSFTIIEPDYDFESFDKSHHRLWCVNNQHDIEIALAKFSSIKSMYIADGHHRMGAMI